MLFKDVAIYKLERLCDSIIDTMQYSDDKPRSEKKEHGMAACHDHLLDRVLGAGETESALTLQAVNVDTAAGVEPVLPPDKIETIEDDNAGLQCDCAEIHAIVNEEWERCAIDLHYTAP